MKTKEYEAIRIFLLPSLKDSKEILDFVKEKVDSKKCYFYVDNMKSSFLHTTLYYAEFSTARHDELIETLGELSKKTKRIVIENPKLTRFKNFVGLDMERKGFLSLHKTVLKNFNSLREGHVREKYVVGIKRNQFSKRKKDTILKYGYEYSDEFFTPHITLACFKKEEDAKEFVVKTTQSFEIKKIRLEFIALGSGKKGTVTNIIKSYKLVP